MKTRRDALTLLGAQLLLGGCSMGPSATKRFRVIVMAEVDGKPVEGSSVMEIRYSRVTHSLIGTGGSSTLHGEAVILDLNGKGTIYVLPYQYRQGTLDEFYNEAFTHSLGIRSGVGTLSDKDFDVLKSAHGRMPLSVGHPAVGTTLLPVFVAFEDETDRSSIYEVDPDNIQASFPGVAFKGIDLEITDASITTKIRSRLPWLNSGDEVWPRDPPGRLRPDRDSPLSYKMLNWYFFGPGDN